MIQQYKVWLREEERLAKVRRIEFDREGVWVLPWDRGYYLHVGEECDLLPFTGRKDRKDVEIYEGHIVRQPGDVFIVSSDDSAFQLEVCRELKDGTIERTGSAYSFSALSKDCEVVGSIYLNPELLI